MRFLLPICSFLFLCFVSAASAGELETDIIYSTRADELQSVLAPLAAPEGSVAAYRDQLIIRATPEKLDVIRDMLKKIDRPLKNLRISVRYRQQQTEARQDTDMRGQVHILTNQVSSQVSIHVQDESKQDRQSSTYSISALEGATVFIATGTEIPVLTVIGNSNGVVAGNQYVPVQSGMEVTPHLQPDGRLMLTIHFQQAALNEQGNIDRDTTQTQIQTRLGEWTALSQLEQSRQISGNSISGKHQEQEKSNAPLEILVEEIP